MPLAAVMYVYLEEHRADSLVAELSAELMRQFGLDDEEFHAGGPLL